MRKITKQTYKRQKQPKTKKGAYSAFLCYIAGALGHAYLVILNNQHTGPDTAKRKNVKANIIGGCSE
jgi:hypothetical protein